MHEVLAVQMLYFVVKKTGTDKENSFQLHGTYLVYVINLTATALKHNFKHDSIFISRFRLKNITLLCTYAIQTETK